MLGTLDLREQGGYDRQSMRMFWRQPGSQRVVRGADALVYLATEENPHYLGPATSEVIAEQVLASLGPSGPNDQYVFELEAALHDLGARDEHVAEIAGALRELRKASNPEAGA